MITGGKATQLIIPEFLKSYLFTLSYKLAHTLFAELWQNYARVNRRNITACFHLDTSNGKW